MTISLRKRKQGKSNKVALLLDIYYGSKTDASGKTKYLRKFEALNLYLIDNPKTSDDKMHNKNILQLANNIKSKRELELHSEKHGFSPKTNFKDSNFYEYFISVVDLKKDTPSYNNYKSVLKTQKTVGAKNFSPLQFHK